MLVQIQVGSSQDSLIYITTVANPGNCHRWKMSSPKCKLLHHSSAYGGNHRNHSNYSVCAHSGGLQQYLMIKQKQTADAQTQYLFDSFCFFNAEH